MSYYIYIYIYIYDISSLRVNDLDRVPETEVSLPEHRDISYVYVQQQTNCIIFPESQRFKVPSLKTRATRPGTWELGIERVRQKRLPGCQKIIKHGDLRFFSFFFQMMQWCRYMWPSKSPQHRADRMSLLLSMTFTQEVLLVASTETRLQNTDRYIETVAWQTLEYV